VTVEKPRVSQASLMALDRLEVEHALLAAALARTSPARPHEMGTGNEKAR